MTLSVLVRITLLGKLSLCLGTGTEVECLLDDTVISQSAETTPKEEAAILGRTTDFLVLISPFFFWGTSMVVMKVRTFQQNRMRLIPS